MVNGLPLLIVELKIDAAFVITYGDSIGGVAVIPIIAVICLIDV